MSLLEEELRKLGVLPPATPKPPPVPRQYTGTWYKPGEEIPF
jgi:hypothetical protein